MASITAGTPVGVVVPIDTANIDCVNLSASNSIVASNTVQANNITATAALSGVSCVVSGGASVGSDLTVAGSVYTSGAGAQVTSVGNPNPGSYVQAAQQLRVNGSAGLGIAYDTVNLPATKYFYVAATPASINLPGWLNPDELCATYAVPAGVQNADLYEVRIPFTGSITSAATDGQEWQFYLTNTLGGGPGAATTSVVLHFEGGTAVPFSLEGGVSPAITTATGATNSTYIKGGLISLLYDTGATNLYLYARALNSNTGGAVWNSPNVSGLITAYN